MPIFEYRCKKCEHEFETLVLGREKPECPTCHGSKLERLLSTFAAVTGGSSMERSASPGGCGSCGDPRGPGACSMN
jgi:putative FmdB family regulatory protein